MISIKETKAFEINGRLYTEEQAAIKDNEQKLMAILGVEHYRIIELLASDKKIRQQMIDSLIVMGVRHG